VVEKKVDEELITGNFEAELPTHEGESKAEFQQESRDVAHECIFDIALMRLIPETEKIEVVRVLQNLGGKPGVKWCEASVKICHSSAFSQMELVFDLNTESVARPGLRKGLAGIPLPEGRVKELRDQDDDMEPG
jgi:hypothetical protein